MANRLPTPELGHLTRADFDQVYEPSQDTFLFLDALELDAPFLRSRNPLLCLEVGFVPGGVPPCSVRSGNTN